VKRSVSLSPHATEIAAALGFFGAFRNSICFPLRAEAKSIWWTRVRTSPARDRGLSIALRFSPASWIRRNFPNSHRAVLEIRAVFALGKQISAGVLVPITSVILCDI
jgi:hypothetical protein